MSFSYEDYLFAAFWLPAAVVMFTVIHSILSLKSVIKRFRKERSFEKILPNICALLVVGILMLIALQSLSNGGLALAVENKDSVQVACGTITEITEPSKRFRMFKSSNKHGADISIDYSQYFAMTGGEFDIGDEVEIWYLPESRVILKIEHLEDHNQ